MTMVGRIEDGSKMVASGPNNRYLGTPIVIKLTGKHWQWLLCAVNIACSDYRLQSLLHPQGLTYCYHPGSVEHNTKYVIASRILTLTAILRSLTTR